MTALAQRSPNAAHSVFMRPLLVLALAAGGPSRTGQHALSLSETALPEFCVDEERAAVAAGLNAYLTRGWTVQHCQKTNLRGVTATDCRVLPQIDRAITSLNSEDFIWVSFEPNAFDMGELIRLWGPPDSIDVHACGKELRWSWPALHMVARLQWNDAPGMPEPPLLMLEHAEPAGLD